MPYNPVAFKERDLRRADISYGGSRDPFAREW
jgi:hypothetical protein